MQKPKGEEERVADNATETPLVSAGLSASSDVSSDMGKDSLTTPLDIHVDGNSESEIPGLDSAACDDGNHATPHLLPGHNRRSSRLRMLWRRIYTHKLADILEKRGTDHWINLPGISKQVGAVHLRSNYPMDCHAPDIRSEHRHLVHWLQHSTTHRLQAI